MSPGNQRAIQIWLSLPLLAVVASAILALRSEREMVIRETRLLAQRVADQTDREFRMAIAGMETPSLPGVDADGRLREEGFLYPLVPEPKPANDAQAWFAAGRYQEVLDKSPDALSTAGLPLASLSAWKLLQAETDIEGLKQGWKVLTQELVVNHPSVLSKSLLRQGKLLMEERRADVDDIAWFKWHKDENLRDILRKYAGLLRSPHTGWIGKTSGMWPTSMEAWMFHTDDLRGEVPTKYSGWRVVLSKPVFNLCVDILNKANAQVPPYARVSLMLHPMAVGDPYSTPLATAGQGLVQVIVSYAETSDFHLAVLRHMKVTGLALGLAFLACAIGAWQTHRTLKKQKELSEQKSNFISSVSHELRAPLASLRLMSESLTQGTVSEPARVNEYHRVMHEESVRLSSLVDNVLDVARIERGAKKYEFSECNLEPVVASVTGLLGPQAERRGVTWCIEMQPINPWPHANSQAIHQALLNLIDNALKHAPDGSFITIRSGPVDPQHWYMSVEDQGPGIPEQERERVFDLFYRIGSELRREITGAGLGLGLVKHIAEGHGGNVMIEDASGGGARVTMKLKMFPA